ncbi:MAG: NUDIX domain-containing protein [Nanoarchaeota archaeon]|nr:NUDIX domain-containing protein [Nanoarchaeota archaeon]
MTNKKYSGFIITSDSGKVLLQHRDNNAPISPNCWAVFGGKMKNSETPLEAVNREAKEELGIIADFKFLIKVKYEENDGLHEVNIFTAKLKYPLEILKKQLAEGDNVELFSQDDLKKINLSESSKLVLDLFFKKEKMK